MSKKFVEEDFQNNKLKISGKAPTFVVPINQESWQESQQSECWVFTMGVAGFCSYGEATFQIDESENATETMNTNMHEIFQLSVEHVMFEHVNHYALWREDVCRESAVNSLSRGYTSFIKDPSD